MCKVIFGTCVCISSTAPSQCGQKGMWYRRILVMQGEQFKQIERSKDVLKL